MQSGYTVLIMISIFCLIQNKLAFQMYKRAFERPWKCGLNEHAPSLNGRGPFAPLSTHATFLCLSKAGVTVAL